MRYDTPSWVVTILAARGTEILAHILLTAAFWSSGLIKLADFSGATAEAAGLGLPAPAFVAALTIVTQLTGSALILTDRHVWLGAGALGVFTFLAALLADPFWSPEAPPHAFATFMEHMGLIGGFILAAILGLQRDAR